MPTPGRARHGFAAGVVPSGVEIAHAASYDEARERPGRAAVAMCPRTEQSGSPMKLLNYMAEGEAIVARASVEDVRAWENVPDRLEAVYHRVLSRAGVRPAAAPVTGVRA